MSDKKKIKRLKREIARLEKNYFYASNWRIAATQVAGDYAIELIDAKIMQRLAEFEKADSELRLVELVKHER